MRFTLLCLVAIHATPALATTMILPGTSETRAAAFPIEPMIAIIVLGLLTLSGIILVAKELREESLDRARRELRQAELHAIQPQVSEAGSPTRAPEN